MKAIFSYLTVFIFSVLTLVGCGPKGDGHNHEASAEAHTETSEADHDHAAEADHDHSGHGHDHAAEADQGSAAHDHAAEGAITLSAAQAGELGIRYETITPTPFSEIIRTGGSLESAPGDRSSVVATASGIVTFGGKPLSEGVKVAKGAPLLSITSEDMSRDNLPQEISDARDRLAKATSDLERAEALAVDKIVTAAELSAARLESETARRNLEVLGRNAASGGRRVVAPSGGYLTSLLVAEGDYVAQGDLLATVAANRNLVLRADLPQRYATRAEALRSANFTTPYDGRSYDLASMKGRQISSARALGEGSATLPIRFEFENGTGLVSGSVVEVFLKGAERRDVITVPLTAITEEQGAHYVYLRTCTDAYAKRAVKLGATDGHRVEIVSGLEPGLDVVADGAYYVRLASMSNAIPDGHAH